MKCLGTSNGDENGNVLNIPFQLSNWFSLDVLRFFFAIRLHVKETLSRNYSEYRQKLPCSQYSRNGKLFWKRRKFTEMKKFKTKYQKGSKSPKFEKVETCCIY